MPSLLLYPPLYSDFLRKKGGGQYFSIEKVTTRLDSKMLAYIWVAVLAVFVSATVSAPILSSFLPICNIFVWLFELLSDESYFVALFTVGVDSLENFDDIFENFVLQQDLLIVV